MVTLDNALDHIAFLVGDDAYGSVVKDCHAVVVALKVMVVEEAAHNR
jgi:hypothetical protein